VKCGEPVELRIIVKINTHLDSLVLGYGIKDRLGQVMFGTNTWHTHQVLNNLGSGDCYEFKVLFAANLGEGSYSIQTALVDRETHLSANYEWRDYAILFDVINVDKPVFAGSQWMNARIEIKLK
jgi:lipopolysaccharide transport system ATP-binding protein